MKQLKIYRIHQPLRTPYRLSFGILDAFETLIVELTRTDGRSGVGEITPLPGYSHESITTAEAALDRVGAALEGGMPWDVAIDRLVADDPMVASALVCAAETAEEGLECAFSTAVAGAFPLAALCGGDTPEEAAAQASALVDAGYRHLKLKAGGGSVAEDIGRLEAVVAAVGSSAQLSIDANQRLSVDDARRLCDRAADFSVELIEQPFSPAAWEDFSRLAQRSAVPLMLDESIWTAADIDRAADVGAQWVKLKLCKHPGMAASRGLIERARSRGLKVVYGNGVQGAIGNHLEARVYAAAALDTPAELNGALKIGSDPFAGRFAVADGRVRADGLGVVKTVLEGLPLVRDFVFITKG